MLGAGAPAAMVSPPSAGVAFVGSLLGVSGVVEMWDNSVNFTGALVGDGEKMDYNSYEVLFGERFGNMLNTTVNILSFNDARHKLQNIKSWDEFGKVIQESLNGLFSARRIQRNLFKD